MNDRPAEPFNWRTLHGVVVLLVLAAYLVSIRGILNPFLLFLLLLFVLSPFAGTRHYVLMVTATGVLTLVWILDTTGFLLAPFLLALVLAYVLHPLVALIERRRVSRSLAVMLLALPALVAIILLVVLGIPALSAQIAEFLRSIPDLIRAGIARIEAFQLELERRDLPFLNEQELLARVRSIQPEAVTAYLQERQEELARRIWQGILGVGRGIGTVLSILGYVFLTPILTFYLLRDWERIEDRLSALLPPPQRQRTLGFAREYDRLLASYLRGQLLAAAIIGVLTWIGFLLAGFPYAFLLGMVAGIFNVIPYMGLVASLIPALVIALLSGDPLIGLAKIAVVFGAVQTLDQVVVGPRVVGEAVGLHPVWVILALSVAGYFFGFVGLLIAVPLAVLVKLLLLHALERYRASSLFRGDRSLVAPD